MADEQESAVSSSDEDAAAEAIFAEFASTAEPSPDNTADEGDDLNDQQDSQEDQPGDKPGTDKPVAAVAPAVEAPTDIWSNATPEQRAALEQMQRDYVHRESSLKGRLSAADRRLAELSKQPVRQEGSNEDKPAGNILESDEIKRFREEYGEIASPLIPVFEKMAAEIAELKKPIGELETQRTEAFLLEQLKAYEAAHGDWEDYAEDPGFEPWLANQPRHIKEAAARNRFDIVDAAEASDVLSRYKSSLGKSATPAPSPQPDPKRQRQREGARGVGVQGKPVATGIPDDPEQAFDHFARLADAKGRRERQRA